MGQTAGSRARWVQAPRILVVSVPHVAVAGRMNVEAIDGLFEGGKSAQARAYVESARRTMA